MGLMKRLNLNKNRRANSEKKQSQSLWSQWELGCEWFVAKIGWVFSHLEWKGEEVMDGESDDDAEDENYWHEWIWGHTNGKWLERGWWSKTESWHYEIWHESCQQFMRVDTNAVVTCGIRLFQNYCFSLRRRPSEIILFRAARGNLLEIISQFFHRLFTGRSRIFSNVFIVAEIILELL